MLLPLLLSALLHPVHETVSEVQWNPQTRRVEVALRMSVLDQQWILRHHGDKKQDVKKWATKYLTQSFQLDPTDAKDAKRATYRWVGRKDEGAHVWWFFEIQPASGQKPKILSQRMFFERDEGFANRILILAPSLELPESRDAETSPRKDATVPRRTVTLTIQHPTANLDVDADDEREEAKR